MRPNSLFFDRGGKTSFSRALSMFITVAFLAFVGYIVIRYKYFTYILREEFLTTPDFGFLILGYIVLFTAFALIIRWANCHVRRMPFLWALAVFVIALAPRLYLYSRISYVPTSDFTNYYNMGLAFTRGDFAQIAQTAENYHIQSFSGLGILNGLIMLAFGTSIRSFQLVQCVITSLSSVMVYLIARRFDEGSAPAAGLLFALYPANIVFSQVTSNQHLAVFFALVSVLLALVSLSAVRRARAVLSAVFSGVTLLLSYYAHPSTAPTLIAYGIFWLIVFFSSLRQKQTILRLLLIAFAFSVAFFGLRAAANAGMQTLLGADVSEANSSMLAKIVIGLNPDTGGAYSASDWGMIWQQPQSEQNAFCLQVIRERLGQDNLFGLLDTKIMRMWMVKDTSLDWPFYGITSIPNDLSALMQGIELLDFFYVAGLFLFAWFGGLLRRRGGTGDLLLLILLGWMAVHLLIEIQTRYRYFAMPFLMIFAAYGLFAIIGPRKHQPQTRQYTACLNPDYLQIYEIPPVEQKPAGGGSLYSAMDAAIAEEQLKSSESGEI